MRISKPMVQLKHYSSRVFFGGVDELSTLIAKHSTNSHLISSLSGDKYDGER